MAGTCATTADGITSPATAGGGEIMLFGVRLVVDSMRKSVSMSNLSQYEQPQELLKNNGTAGGSNAVNNTGNSSDGAKEDVTPGYASADDAVPNSSGGSRERKRGIPWTEEEHKLFLLGLQKVGKGDWRGISRNFVKTRTPTQVASHAQKYFLRRSNLNRRRRRSSLFDITTETVAATPMEEEQVHPQDSASQTHSVPSPALQETNGVGGFHLMPAFPLTINPAALPIPIENPMENLTLVQVNQAANNPSTKLIRPIPVAPQASMISDLSLNLKSSTAEGDPLPLSLKLSLLSNERESSMTTRHSAFQVMSSFNRGDSNSIISVA